MRVLKRAILIPFVVIVVGCGNETEPTPPPAPVVPNRQLSLSDFHNIEEWVRSNDDILEFRIGTNEKTYQAKDEIHVLLELKNVSQSTIFVEPVSYFPFGSTDQLVFTGPSGDVKYIGNYKSMASPHPQPLLAGDSLNIMGPLTFFEDILLSGKYSMSYRYVCFDDYKTPNCWKGAIQSNTVTFQRK
jgi:hypothetical protein